MSVSLARVRTAAPSRFAFWRRPRRRPRRRSSTGPTRSLSLRPSGSSTAAWSAQRAATRAAGTTIYTVTTLQIIEDLTGIAGTSVEVWELGGVLGDEFLYVGGAVEYRIGQEVLVCLERGPLRAP